MDDFSLMVENVVHTSSESSVFLAGKSQSWHGGNLRSEREHKAALFLANINFVIAGGGAKIVKHAAHYHKYCKVIECKHFSHAKVVALR